MSNTPAITFNVELQDDGAVQVVHAKINEIIVFALPLELQNPDARSLYATKLQEQIPGAELPAVISSLEALAAQPSPAPGAHRPPGRDRLLELTGDVRLFHQGTTAYASVPVIAGEAVHWENHAVRGTEFRLWLTRRFYEGHRKAPKDDAVKEVLELLVARALFDGPETPVATRVVGHEHSVYLDLANEKWEAVRITAGGWEVVADPPVRFVRHNGMQPLPRPVPGGSLEQLRVVTNLGDDASWCLAVSWLVGCLLPRGPYPILAVNGEQGSAKSTTCKMFRRLIDPNVADLRSVPREERELLIAATSAWIMGFDNLSRVNQHLSDALCRLATGAGLGVRELYTNAGQQIFSAARPILFNGIEELVTRPDLLDRCLTINLPSIPPTGRVSESELMQRYEDARPQILGALLDAVTAALRNRPTIRLAELPRMADFAGWVVAAESALPWSAGTFLQEYAASQDAAVDVALDASAIGAVVVDLVHEQGQWEGTASELLVELARRADDTTRHRVDFPRTAYGLSNALRRLVPVLRQRGVEVVLNERRGKRRDRIVRLERAGEARMEPSAASAPPAPAASAAQAALLSFPATDPPQLEADEADEADDPTRTSTAATQADKLDDVRMEALKLARHLNYPPIAVDGVDGAAVDKGLENWDRFVREAAAGAFVEVYEALLQLSSSGPTNDARGSDRA